MELKCSFKRSCKKLEILFSVFGFSVRYWLILKHASVILSVFIASQRTFWQDILKGSIVSQIEINGRRNGQKHSFYTVFLLQKRKNRRLKTIGWPNPVMDHRKKRKKIILLDLSWFETILRYFGFFDMKALWETLSKEINMSITQSDFFFELTLFLCEFFSFIQI